MNAAQRRVAITRKQRLYVDGSGVLRRDGYGVGRKLSRDEIAKLGIAVPAASRTLRAIPKPTPTPLEFDTIQKLPASLREVATEIVRDPSMNGTIKAVMERHTEFSSTATALLTGVALNPDARAYFDARLDSMWRPRNLPKVEGREVVVGAGLHAAIYCAVRRALGHPTPIVLERSVRVGGAFAVSRGASFYLNSRNRPGPLSVPGEQMGSLNVLPGSMLQPSDLGSSEYQSNDALAWVIRCSLAMNAEVYSGVNISELGESLDEGRDMYRTSIRWFDNENDTYLVPGRTIIATGLNEPNRIVQGILGPNPRVLGFEQFMARFDSPFPLRGMKRVAVIGAGDGGKTVIEALVGQGPAGLYSVASLDYVERIDWYGCEPKTRKEWEDCARSRYKGLGRVLPRERGDRARVNPLPTASFFAKGYEVVFVDEIPYDYVIDCAGFSSGTTVYNPYGFSNFAVGGRAVGLQARSREVYLVGPACNFPLSDTEQKVVNGISENSTSLFRYAPRTAALAAELDKVV